MFSCFVVHCCEPDRYLFLHDGKIRDPDWGKKLCISTIADFLTAFVVLILGLCGAELGLSPTVQYLMLGMGVVLNLDCLLGCIAFIKMNYAPKFYLFKTDSIQQVEEEESPHNEVVDTEDINGQ